MYNFPIGVILESFRRERSEAIRSAAALGANGIQMYATHGDNSPENLNASDRRALLDEVRGNGLVFSALCGDMGMGFWDRQQHAELIEKSKRIIDLAKDLDTNVVTTHIGVVPADKNHERYKIMQEACFQLARYAESCEAYFAVETGPEPADVLKGFLNSLGSKGVSVNLDPANLVMSLNVDPVEAVYTLKDYIVHTHAKDGLHYQMIPPEYDYHVLPMPEEYKNIRAYEEVPLGKGAVDFNRYLKALDEIGYKGFLTIEREVGAKPEQDIRTAYDYLHKIIGTN